MVVEPGDGSGWSDREMPETPKEGKISVRTKNIIITDVIVEYSDTGDYLSVAVSVYVYSVTRRINPYRPS